MSQCVFLVVFRKHTQLDIIVSGRGSTASRILSLCASKKPLNYKPYQKRNQNLTKVGEGLEPTAKTFLFKNVSSRRRVGQTSAS